MSREVKVTATIEFVYDLDELGQFGIDSPEAAIQDVVDMISSGDLTPDDFTYNTVSDAETEVAGR